MKVTIDVANRKEGELLRAGLNDRTVRAFVLIVGALQGLTPTQARRVLTFVGEAYADETPTAHVGPEAATPVMRPSGSHEPWTMMSK